MWYLQFVFYTPEGFIGRYKNGESPRDCSLKGRPVLSKAWSETPPPPPPHHPMPTPPRGFWLLKWCLNRWANVPLAIARHIEHCRGTGDGGREWVWQCGAADV